MTIAFVLSIRNGVCACHNQSAQFETSSKRFNTRLASKSNFVNLVNEKEPQKTLKSRYILE